MCVKMIDLHIYLYGGLSYDSLHNLDCVVTGKKPCPSSKCRFYFIVLWDH